MKRRDFIKATGIGVAGAAVAAPAIAQSTPEIKWRMSCSWPKSRDTLYGGAQLMAKAAADVTEKKIQSQAVAACGIKPRPKVAGAVQEATSQRGPTAS